MGRDWSGLEGSPFPLGATWIADQRAFNFALYSRHAQSVTLLLYRDNDLSQPVRALMFDQLANRTGRVWHMRVRRDDVPDARYYAYSIDGPLDPAAGLRFDRSKVLFDPYATQLVVPPTLSRAAASSPGSNAGRAPVAQLPGPRTPFDWQDDRPPRHTSDLVIYELHVRGFTAHTSSGLPELRRGTYAGLIDKIPYLTALGVTAVELLPVYQYDAEPGGNYWGYMPLSFFAPHGAYAMARDPADAIDEFRTMVKALHAAGIEVILDVVYNHTTEQGATGPSYSLRGIDNSTYYLLAPDLATYFDATGTGNTLRTAHPAVRRMIVDSLRYWVREMHVDGFRFDLATVLSRADDGHLDVDAPAILAEIASEPELAGIRLIAEPWDISDYQLGRAFPGISWMQWNDRFRNDVRAFVKSDPGKVPSLMQRLYGSDDVFPDTGDTLYRPWQSVNFITCHDGFCLYDLVSYNTKHNEANGHDNRDGSDDNRSWNCGFEGASGAPDDVVALRRRQVKNFCVLLLVANGTPMFVAGDEVMRTQNGNNNPYNQDNETSWLDWGLVQRNADILRFWTGMIALRKAHPTFSRSRFWRDAVGWFGRDAGPDLSYESRTLAVLLDGSAEGDADFYLIANAYWEDLSFALQQRADRPWRRVVDTGLASPDDIVEPGAERAVDDARYMLRARTVALFTR